MDKDEIDYKAIAASIILANGREDLLRAEDISMQDQDIFNRINSVRDQYNNIDSPEELATFLERLQNEQWLDIFPEKLTADASIKYSYEQAILSNPPAFKDLINSNILAFNQFLKDNRAAFESIGWYYHDNLPNQTGMNPPYFSDNRTHFVDISYGHAVYAAALDEIPKNTINQLEERLRPLANAARESRESQAIYLAMLDSYPAGFDDGSAFAVDGVAPTGEALLAAQNAFLQENLRLYQNAEAEQDGSGRQVLINFISESFPDGIYGSPSYEAHGILTAVQALDSFEREAIEFGVYGQFQLAILPNHHGDFNYENYEPHTDPRLPVNAVVTGWSVSSGFDQKIGSEFVASQIANGYSVFAGTGNELSDIGMSSFLSPNGSVGVGGNSSGGSEECEYIISEDTDIAYISSYIDGDSQTVGCGTSYNTPDAAATFLAHVVADILDDKELNSSVIPQDFEPQLTYLGLNVVQEITSHDGTQYSITLGNNGLYYLRDEHNTIIVGSSVIVPEIFTFIEPQHPSHQETADTFVMESAIVEWGGVRFILISATDKHYYLQSLDEQVVMTIDPETLNLKLSMIEEYQGQQYIDIGAETHYFEQVLLDFDTNGDGKLTAADFANAPHPSHSNGWLTASSFNGSPEIPPALKNLINQHIKLR